jgi:hypothetical protein
VTAPRLLSVLAASKECGVARAWLRRKIEAGDVRTVDGKVPEDALDSIRELNRAREGGPPPAAPVLTSEPVPVPPPAAAPAGEAASLATDLRRANISQKEKQARLLDLKAAKMAGELVPLAEVRQEARQVATAVRQRLQVFSGRLTLQLAALFGRVEGADLERSIEKLIDDEVRAVLQELHTSRFVAEEQEGSA